MKGIYKRKNSKNWQIRYMGLDGVLKKESAGTDKFRDAQALLHKRKADIQVGKQPAVKKIKNYTFKQLVERYNPWMEGRHRSADSKKYRINEMVARFGGLKLREFTTYIVEQYQTDILKSFSNAHANKNISLLKAMINKAVEWEMVEEDVLKRVRKVKSLQEVKRLRYLLTDECHRLMDNCDENVRPIVILALNTGMRKGEILGLEWGDVDLSNGYIHVEDTKNGERRDIPITGALRNSLTGLVRSDDVPYVFYNPKTMDRWKDVRRTFKTALKHCGIKDFHFHDLRHTFASHLVMCGTDLLAVKEFMGHKDIKMTLRYAHLAPKHKVQAISSLDSTINNREGLLTQLLAHKAENGSYSVVSANQNDCKSSS